MAPLWSRLIFLRPWWIFPTPMSHDRPSRFDVCWPTFICFATSKCYGQKCWDKHVRFLPWTNIGCSCFTRPKATVCCWPNSTIANILMLSNISPYHLVTINGNIFVKASDPTDELNQSTQVHDPLHKCFFRSVWWAWNLAAGQCVLRAQSFVLTIFHKFGGCQLDATSDLSCVPIHLATFAMAANFRNGLLSLFSSSVDQI